MPRTWYTYVPRVEIQGATNIVSCIRRNPSEARRHPYETRPPRRPRCSPMSYVTLMCQGRGENMPLGCCCLAIPSMLYRVNHFCRMRQWNLPV